MSPKRTTGKDTSPETQRPKRLCTQRIRPEYYVWASDHDEFSGHGDFVPKGFHPPNKSGEGKLNKSHDISEVNIAPARSKRSRGAQAIAESKKGSGIETASQSSKRSGRLRTQASGSGDGRWFTQPRTNQRCLVVLSIRPALLKFIQSNTDKPLVALEDAVENAQETVSQHEKGRLTAEKKNGLLLGELRDAEEQVIDRTREIGIRIRNLTTDEKLDRTQARLADREEEVLAAQRKTDHLNDELKTVYGLLSTRDAECSEARQNLARLAEQLKGTQDTLSAKAVECVGAHEFSSRLADELKDIHEILNAKEVVVTTTHEDSLRLNKELKAATAELAAIKQVQTRIVEPTCSRSDCGKSVSIISAVRYGLFRLRQDYEEISTSALGRIEKTAKELIRVLNITHIQHAQQSHTETATETTAHNAEYKEKTSEICKKFYATLEELQTTTANQSTKSFATIAARLDVLMQGAHVPQTPLTPGPSPGSSFTSDAPITPNNVNGQGHEHGQTPTTSRFFDLTSEESNLQLEHETEIESLKHHYERLLDQILDKASAAEVAASQFGLMVRCATSVAENSASNGDDKGDQDVRATWQRAMVCAARGVVKAGQRFEAKVVSRQNQLSNACA